jgi:TolB protein
MRAFASVGLVVAALLVAVAPTARSAQGDDEIAFLSERGQSGLGVFTMRADGTDVRQLTAPPPYALWQTPSPEGRLVAFVRPPLFFDEIGGTRPERTHSELWVVRSDGTQPHRVLRLSDFVVGRPAWSPDSQTLAYVDGHSGAPSIWAISLDSGTRRRLAASATDPAWSSDNHLAFVRKGALFVAASDGSGARSVAAGAQGPAWSPDSRRLAFARPNPDSTGGPLVVIDPDGTLVRTIREARALGSLAWTPDGNWITFVSDAPGIPVAEVKPDGTSLHVLFNDYAGSVAWLPDGSRILYFGIPARFADRQYGRWTLFTRNGDGGDRRPFFPRALGDDGPPSWLSTGEALHYVASDGVHLVSADGTYDEQLSPLGSGSWARAPCLARLRLRRQPRYGPGATRARQRAPAGVVAGRPAAGLRSRRGHGLGDLDRERRRQ